MMRGTHGNAGLIPNEAAQQLGGKTYKNFDEFRNDFWRTVATSPYANEFGASNISMMKKGLAPIASKSQQYGEQKSYVLHHLQPIQHGGGVYDLNNSTFAAQIR
ncbi:colicin [Brevibacillus sp. AY1]|nr:colicin [Brevibacillus sp. AY1]MDH4620046.1 colicin [Brevibacillus sp. AY1]